MDRMRFVKDLYEGRIEQICTPSVSERVQSEAEELRQLNTAKKQHFDEQSCDSLMSSPFYDVLLDHKDALPEKIPAEVPQDKGIQHEIDLVTGTKYCPGCDGKTDVEVHKDNLRQLLGLMRKHKLKANL
ncbi:hypothetical protein PInf_015295 [Phytophthora infestans]|nr:hypothetical protein PInf_015295 [Phytophthora infestans]